MPGHGREGQEGREREAEKTSTRWALLNWSKFQRNKGRGWIGQGDVPGKAKWGYMLHCLRGKKGSNSSASSFLPPVSRWSKFTPWGVNCTMVFGYVTRLFFFFFFASPLESQSLLGLVGSNLGSVATSVLTPEGPWRLGWSLVLVPSGGSSRIQWWRLQTGFATIGLGEAKVRKRATDWAPSGSPEVRTLNPLNKY